MEWFFLCMEVLQASASLNIRVVSPLPVQRPMTQDKSARILPDLAIGQRILVSNHDSQISLYKSF